MNTQYAFLKKNNIPDRDELQAAINRLGYDLEVDKKLSFFEDEGFSPCTLDGRDDVGFELICEPLDRDEENEAILDVAGDNDYCINMSWGGDLGDMACVMIVSLALLQDFGATISFEGEGPETHDSLVSGIREGLDSFRR